MSAPTTAAGTRGKGQGQGLQDGARLHLMHANGMHTHIRSNIEFVSVEEEVGRTSEFALYPVGTQLALYRMDDGKMKFIHRKSLGVREVLAMALAPNKKVVAISERRTARDGPPSQLSIFHLASLTKVRTITSASARAPFTSVCFSGDSKFLVAMSGEGEWQLCVWQWDKEAALAAVHVNAQASSVCCSPSAQHFQITVAGVAYLRLWSMSTDGDAKMMQLLPQSREQENFVDHTWVRGTIRRMVALAEPLDTVTRNAMGASAVAYGGSRGSTIYVFQAIEQSPFLEVKQTLPSPGSSATRLETVVGHAKGFLVAGSHGFFAVYEKTDDRKDPFMLIKTLRAGEETFRSLALSSNKETVLAVSKSERLTSFSLSSVDLLEEGALVTFLDLHKGGFHKGPILALDVCSMRPIVVTSGMDRTLRVWNYIKGRCDLVHDCKSEEAYAVAIHPSGFQVVGGFKERVRVYNTLLDDLRCIKELPVKHCRELRYAEGGHMFAAALGIAVAVYSSVSLSCLASFTAHVGIVRCLAFSRGDRVLYSAGADGNIHAWDMVNWAKVEEPGGLDASCPYTGLVMEQACTVDDVNRIACCGGDQYLREIAWMDSTRDANRITEFFVGEDVSLTVLALSPYNSCLFAGLDNGNIRVYEWPLNGSFVEYPCHKGPVSGLRVSFDHTRLLSTSEDGALMTFALQRVENGVDLPFILEASDAAAVGNTLLNADFFLVTNEELTERHQEFQELKKLYDDLRSDSDYNLKRKDAEWTEELKTLQEENKKNLQFERSRFDELQGRFEHMMLEHMQQAEKRDHDHSEALRELEDQYEHKLAVEMERYDKLSEEIELIKEQCNTKLDEQKVASEAALRDLETKASRLEQQLKHQIERLIEEAKSNDNTYREVLDQQEGEYESELKELIAAAEHEILNERENTAKVRAVAQGKHTKLDQLKKKMSSIEHAALQREKLLEHERHKNARLEATLAHLERHLEERSRSLEEKEKTIVELRNNNRTLENFRYVLDHRLKQLMEERGPVTKHIEDLEAHIRAMYDDLVAEFARKKEQGLSNQAKDMKLVTLQNEVNNLRNFLRVKDRYIATFKQELSTSVASLSVGSGKGGEDEALKALYRKYVRNEHNTSTGRKPRLTPEDALERVGGLLGETGGPATNADGVVKKPMGQAANVQGNQEESGPVVKVTAANHNQQQEGANREKVAVHTLLEGLQEANRQRSFMEKRNHDLSRKMDNTKKDATKEKFRSINENTTLIAHCNELRKQNLELRREAARLRTMAAEQSGKHEESAEHGDKDGPLVSSRSGAGDNDPATPTRITIRAVDHHAQDDHSNASLKPSKSVLSSTSSAAPGSPNLAINVDRRGAHPLSGPMTGSQSLHGGSSIGSLQKGSTRDLGLIAVRESEVLSLTRQLDHNHRELEMYRMEINSLRHSVGDLTKQLKQSQRKIHQQQQLQSTGSGRRSGSSGNLLPRASIHDQPAVVAQETAAEDMGPGIIKRAALLPRPTPQR